MAAFDGDILNIITLKNSSYAKYGENFNTDVKNIYLIILK